MPGEKVLIVGAGVAGSVLAYWLARHDYHVTVIERSRAEQKLGQGIEIEEPALQVVKAMDIMPALQAHRTGEDGFRLLDEHEHEYAKFGLGGFSPTGALELMRGDLTEVLYKAAREHPNVTYHFETTVAGVTQTDTSASVTIEDRKHKTSRTEAYDFVVGADGMRSRTRQMVLGAPEDIGCYRPIGMFSAYFDIPRADGDWPYSKLVHFPGSRIIWMRPTRAESKNTSVYLIHQADSSPALSAANAAGDRLKQKELWAELFGDLGWEAPRILTQMMKTDNFYSDEMTQIKLDTWSKGRVVFVGDSAWAPTPATGQGNQLAIIGAWVLAQEMARDRSVAAYDNYEKRLRKYVTESQEIPLGGRGPKLFNPQTPMGIWVLRKILGLVALVVRVAMWLGLDKYMPSGEHEYFDLQIDGVEAKKLK